MKIYLEEIRVHIAVQKGFEGYVFLNPRGKKVTRVLIFLIIKALATKIGLKKTLHILYFFGK